jgi:hypothetical protein
MFESLEVLISILIKEEPSVCLVLPFKPSPVVTPLGKTLSLDSILISNSDSPLPTLL